MIPHALIHAVELAVRLVDDDVVDELDGRRDDVDVDVDDYSACAEVSTFTGSTRTAA